MAVEIDISQNIRSSNGSANGAHDSEHTSNGGLAQEEIEIHRQRKKIVVVGLGMVALSFMCGILPPPSALNRIL